MNHRHRDFQTNPIRSSANSTEPHRSSSALKLRHVPVDKSSKRVDGVRLRSESDNPRITRRGKPGDAKAQRSIDLDRSRGRWSQTTARRPVVSGVPHRRHPQSRLESVVQRQAHVGLLVATSKDEPLAEIHDWALSHRHARACPALRRKRARGLRYDPHMPLAAHLQGEEVGDALGRITAKAFARASLGQIGCGSRVTSVGPGRDAKLVQLSVTG